MKPTFTPDLILIVRLDREFWRRRSFRVSCFDGEFICHHLSSNLGCFFSLVARAAESHLALVHRNRSRRSQPTKRGQSKIKSSGRCSGVVENLLQNARIMVSRNRLRSDPQAQRDNRDALRLVYSLNAHLIHCHRARRPSGSRTSARCQSPLFSEYRKITPRCIYWIPLWVLVGGILEGHLDVGVFPPAPLYMDGGRRGKI